MKSAAREGLDPSLAQRRAKAGVRAPRTLKDIISAYLTSREGSVALKTIKIERDLLVGVLEPQLGDRLLSDLGPPDIGEAVSRYAARLKREGRSAGTNANKLLAATRRMFKWARGTGTSSLADPTADLVRPAKEKLRDRVLYDGKVLIGAQPDLNEVGRLIRALEADPSPLPVDRTTRIALHLTILLGFRALEVCGLEWRTIDLESETPTASVTISKTKAGLRTLPLPPQAVVLLRELKARAGRSKFLFPAEEGSKRAEHLHPESLSRAFARSCRRLSLDHATTHDLRRTCLSGLMELGHEGVASRIAGHAAVGVMGRHYDRSRRLDAIRLALDEWAAAVADAALRVKS